MENSICVVTCKTLEQELLLVMRNRGYDHHIFWIEADKHIRPESIQETLDKLPFVSTVLLIFTFPENVMAGIYADIHTLIIPRTAYCMGNLALIDALLAGNWSNRDFLIVPPGNSVKYEQSLLI